MIFQPAGFQGHVTHAHNKFDFVVKMENKIQYCEPKKIMSHNPLKLVKQYKITT